MIQVNPQARDAEPHTMHDINDRRSELAGNLSLAQDSISLPRSTSF